MMGYLDRCQASAPLVETGDMKAAISPAIGHRQGHQPLLALYSRVTTFLQSLSALQLGFILRYNCAADPAGDLVSLFGTHLA